MSRELDAEIAEKLLGWEWDRAEGRESFFLPPVGTPMRDNNWCAEWDDAGRPDWLPEYSDKIEEAWKIVDLIMGDQYAFVFKLQMLTGRPAPGKFWASFKDNKGTEYEGYGPTAPEAICLAALKVREAGVVA